MASFSYQDKQNNEHSQYNKNSPVLESPTDVYPNSHLDYTDTINIEQDNVTCLYNNPAVFSDKAGRLNLSKSRANWGMPRLCLFLCPAVSIEFCRVFAAMFMLVHVYLHPRINGLLLLSGGFVGLGLTISIARVFKSPSNITKNRAMTYFSLYHLLVFFGTSLIVGSSWNSLFFENDIRLFNSSTSFFDDTSNNTSIEWVYENMPIPPLVNIILTAVGYVILSSTTGSGQYLIICLAANVEKDKSQVSFTSITVIFTAIGACTAGFVGAVDMASNWCPADICPSHVNAQAAVLSSSILCLLPIGLACSGLAYYAEDVLHVCKRLFRRHWKETNWNPGRRTTRTPQEIYDECAALLRDHETSFSSSQLAEDSCATEDSERVRSTYDAIRNNSKRYPHQITTSLQEPKLKKLLKNRNFIGAFIGMFVLMCMSLVFQFYGTLYLSQTIPVTNRTGLKWHNKRTEEIDWSHLEAPLDVRCVFGLKIHGLATLLCNGIFILIYLKRQTICRMIKPPWKIWVAPACLAVLAILACVTGVISDVIVLFLLTACIIGCVRVATAVLLHTVLAQCIRTWPPVVLKPTDTPTVVLWSLVPTSLVVSSAILTSIHQLTHLPALPVFFIGALAFLAACSFLVFRTKVI